VRGSQAPLPGPPRFITPPIPRAGGRFNLGQGVPMAHRAAPLGGGITDCGSGTIRRPAPAGRACPDPRFMSGALGSSPVLTFDGGR